jgi:hypothetical protein
VVAETKIIIDVKRLAQSITKVLSGSGAYLLKNRTIRWRCGACMVKLRRRQAACRMNADTIDDSESNAKVLAAVRFRHRKEWI